MRNDGSFYEEKAMTTGQTASQHLKNSHISDDIVLDEDSYEELTAFRNDIVGEDIDLIADIIWSETIPLKDFTVSVAGQRMRFCIFEEAVAALQEVPEGRTAMVGVVQEFDTKSFWLLGVVKGENRADISIEHYNEDGEELKRGAFDITGEIKELWRLWHAVQLALLHPRTKHIFSHPSKAKEYTREKDDSGKRRRIVKYIRRHYLAGEDLKKTLKEIKRNCLCWYVVGHWRHLRSGRTIYIKGYWKGELREMQRNIDVGRLRQVQI